MYLINDAISYKNTVYAKAGDKVKIISRNEPAIIVEDMKGERFTVNINNLSERQIIQIKKK